MKSNLQIKFASLGGVCNAPRFDLSWENFTLTIVTLKNLAIQLVLAKKGFDVDMKLPNLACSGEKVPWCRHGFWRLLGKEELDSAKWVTVARNSASSRPFRWQNERKRMFCCCRRCSLCRRRGKKSPKRARNAVFVSTPRLKTAIVCPRWLVIDVAQHDAITNEEDLHAFDLLER